jgi:hypothetical protein
MDSTVVSPLVVPAAPIIALILQFAKSWFTSLTANPKVLPWISVGMGVAAAIFSGTGATLIAQVLNGVIGGLLASGGYDAVTATTGKVK